MTLSKGYKCNTVDMLRLEVYCTCIAYLFIEKKHLEFAPNLSMTLRIMIFFYNILFLTFSFDTHQVIIHSRGNLSSVVLQQRNFMLNNKTGLTGWFRYCVLVIKMFMNSLFMFLDKFYVSYRIFNLKKEIFASVFTNFQHNNIQTFLIANFN